jgi:hypothetical protein
MLLAFPVLLAGIAAGPVAGPREEQWKKVEEAVSKGLPKTAVEHLEPIIEGAVKDKAFAEAIRAIGQKIALEGAIQGNLPEEKIVRLHDEIAKAPDEMKPVMQAILANWYWHYFQRNRWRFMQRTATAAAPSDDFTTWDLPRIFAEIDKHFTAALGAEKLLKSTPVAEYDALLEKGTMPDTYRPTLYDFVAANALEFYTSGEQAAAKPEDAFEISADSPIFGPVADFIAWKVETTDEDSPKLKAVRLYQALLRFHQDDEDKTALLHWDLERLRYGHNTAHGEGKAARYKAALKRFVDQWGDHEISAIARHAWASVLREEGELVEAHKLAEQGWRAFAESPGGILCYNLMRQIEARSASISVERVWNEPWPTIEVRYRNVTKVYFRLVPYDFEAELKRSGTRHPEQFDPRARAEILSKKPDLEWSADLPPTDDFHERVEEVPAGEDVKPGSYFVIASHDPKFTDKENIVSYAPVWVSNLSLVMRSRSGESLLEGFVLDAASGEPIRDAEVRVWLLPDWRQKTLEELKPTKTDADGLFRISGTTQRSHIVLIRHGNQQLATARGYSVYQHDRTPKPFERTVFFTDRSIYRPGQTIQYKGISIEVDQNRDSYQTIAGRNLTVIFSDVNGKEIERQQTRTNDYGSFSGSFTAPRDRLMGRMSIRVDGNPPGQTAVTVEEYKRPTFQVALDAPKVAPKLGDAVNLSGTATAYTGAAVDGAQVRWRVVREVRFPPWWYWRRWWMPPGAQQGQEIARGTATTDVGGSFPIEFVARPDLSVAEKDEPTFQYTVYADVTDLAGETRSAQRVVNVGYTALSASLSAANWLVERKPVEVSIRTTTLDGEGQQAEGSLKIYSLKQPEKVERAPLAGRPHFPMPRRSRAADAPEPPPDLSNPNSWPLGEVVAERGFTTDAAGNASYTFDLKAGAYRAVLETQDRFGKKVTAELPLRVLDPDAEKLVIKVPHVVDAPSWSVEPGDEFTALWGSGYDTARAYVEIEHRGKLLQRYWTDAERTQATVSQKVTEAMRGGFTLRVTMVRENRAYLNQQRVDVPWSNKNLTIAWERFVSKLAPGQKETWTAVITGPDAKKAVAEMVAALYDQSLDAFLPHNWTSGFGVFRQDYSIVSQNFENDLRRFTRLEGNWPVDQKPVQITYRSFPHEVIGNLWGYQFFGEGRGGQARRALAAAPPAPGMAMPVETAAANRELQMDRNAAMAEGEAMDGQALRQRAAGEPEEKRKGDEGPGAPPAPPADLDQVAARANLNETAFFFPHLVSDKEGEVRLEFTMPEALTQWKFLGFAHDNELRAGLLTDSVVTAKDLMVQPNPPRFLREGDVLEFTVRVTNQSPTRQTGTVRLTFSNARTGASVDAVLGNTQTDQAFDVPSKESRTFSWRLTVPDASGVVVYKAVGSTGRLSDGEEGYLPVLSRRIMVTESLPLPIRGPAEKRFEFPKLLESGKSDTLQSKTLTVQMVSNPSWYAVMALPYLMEFPHECTEQTFNRLYANALARHIANSDAKIRRVFDQWKGTPALDSPLEKNEDLKAVVLEETPWVRQAEAESQARRNVGILFDDNRLNQETSRLLRKLAEQQLGDGNWPWFPGGPPNEYMTLYITTGFGRLRHLGVDIDVSSAVKSLGALDAWIDRIYRRILQHGNKEKNNLSPTIALYLYGRSFFLEDQAIDAKHKEAVDYFLDQARQHWLALANRQSQAHLAVALHRFGDRDAAQGIMRSIKERSVTDEELGMFWRETELSWWWYRAPIETQAMMIEAFDEVMKDAEAVEDCKVWLLKQKQTRDWKTTKATADAIYALLLRGTNLLASDALVEVALAGKTIEPEDVEAGTGFYEKRFVGPQIRPAMGRVSVKKIDEGVAWGSLHWQYLEDVGKITPHEGTPLTLQKALFVKEHTARGPVLNPVEGPIAVGDELVVRVVLRTDRDMEYVHMKDYRGSGTEPVNVLSRYKHQDGLYYYESTRDTATHFFIDYLPKGTYVFEYSVRVQHRGRYQTGMAQIQCMYAPEFNSHSESFTLEVK